MWIFLFFFSNWERSTAAEACGQSTKNVWSMWKAYTRARVDTKWLVYYRNRWLECVGCLLPCCSGSMGEIRLGVRTRWMTTWPAETRAGEATWNGSAANKQDHGAAAFRFYTTQFPCCWSFLGPRAYCRSNPRPGWKQPPLREEPWVPVSCFL